MSDLAKHARPKLDEERLERQWSDIAARTASRPQRAWKPALALAAAIAIAAAFFYAWRRPAPIAVATGVVSVESNTGHTTMTLGDGSRITTGVDTRLAFAEITPVRTRIVLSAGAADFDVHHDPARAFVVEAGNVTLVDTGTQFHVEYTQQNDIRVTVTQGSVRLERGSSAPSNLAAGDSWTSSPVPVASSAAPIATEAPAVDSGTVAPPPKDDVLDRFDALAAKDPDAAFAVLGENGYPRVLDRATPKQLFAMGDVARLSGHAHEAAIAFDALRTHHRTDARAGLAAMQLGRLRQDSLNDASGAEEAYRDAIALSPDAPFREDAEARRVDVLDSMSNRSACADARDAYLARYPAGVHARSVAKRCGGK